MVPVDMSLGKSHGFHRQLEEGEILITADTVVIVNGEVLGKPHSKQEAVEMLLKLSGRSHQVVTAVTLRSATKERTFSVSTDVVFDSLPKENIEYYIDTYKPYDKAGAYAIQEWIGYTGIREIRGSYYNVMGLPVNRLWKELSAFTKD
ncbi:maf-like protein maf [Bacteroides sp. CAG:1060]|nr:maf-like protein maf [Bacteroides sp. CAG:1060]